MSRRTSIDDDLMAGRAKCARGACRRGRVSRERSGAIALAQRASKRKRARYNMIIPI